MRNLAALAASVSALLCMVFTETAYAHVKWFCAFDVSGQPKGLENVLCADFEIFVVLALLCVLAGGIIERTFIGAAMTRALDSVTGRLRIETTMLIRATCFFFFVSLWTLGGIILTPELTTTLTAISWLQLAIAAGLLWRQMLPLSALGIVFLFGFGVYQHGIFHLLDYPIFLGVALYLALIGLRRDFFGVRPLDVVRWSAAITLMWASMEKWAYPQWTFSLLISHPNLTMGYDNETFMRAAGAVEFALSFALLWTPLVRRVAAIILIGMFVSAVVEFGKIDAIGHSVIIVILLAIVGDNAPAAVQEKKTFGAMFAKPLVLATASYGMALAGFMAIYYALHAVIFGTTIG
jgi:hypothetical protein